MYRSVGPSFSYPLSFLGSDVTNVSVERALFKSSSTRVDHAFWGDVNMPFFGTRLTLLDPRKTLGKHQWNEGIQKIHEHASKLLCVEALESGCCWHVARKINVVMQKGLPSFESFLSDARIFTCPLFFVVQVVAFISFHCKVSATV